MIKTKTKTKITPYLEAILSIMKFKMEGVFLNHPFYDCSLIDHTIMVYNKCRDLKGDERDLLLALVHDVGKVDTKTIDPDTGQESYLGHSDASISFCEEAGIELSNMEKDILSIHAKAKFWHAGKSGKKFRPYYDKYGHEFFERLVLLMKANVFGKTSLAEKDLYEIGRIKKLPHRFWYQDHVESE